MTKHITPVPEDNKSHKGCGSEPPVPGPLPQPIRAEVLPRQYPSG